MQEFSRVIIGCLRQFAVGTQVMHMFNPFDHPFLILVGSGAIFTAAAWIGASLRGAKESLVDNDREEFMFILGGTLTLLGLIIGFSFSMAVSRYDQRKNYEEAEANAIGTEYVRTDLLPAADAAKVRTLLKRYLNQRILEYRHHGAEQLRSMNAETARLQSELWSAVTPAVTAQPTAVGALIASGMNDVLNSQGYTQAAWWNRIPSAAWALLVVISLFCNLLIGYSAKGRSTFLLLILPIALCVSLFLIADIDSPRTGVIRVKPQNLEALAQSLHP